MYCTRAIRNEHLAKNGSPLYRNYIGSTHHVNVRTNTRCHIFKLTFIFSSWSTNTAYLASQNEPIHLRNNAWVWLNLFSWFTYFEKKLWMIYEVEEQLTWRSDEKISTWKFQNALSCERQLQKLKNICFFFTICHFFFMSFFLCSVFWELFGISSLKKHLSSF